MNPVETIDKSYPQETEQRHILLIHSPSVAQKALKIVDTYSSLPINRSFVREAALLCDMGISLTDAPAIQYFGEHPYIAHGHLGADLLRKEGFERYAPVCERYTGAGLALEEIIERQFPAPHREMVPATLGEQIICFADKFFSKTHLDEEETVEKARKSTARYGEEDLNRFDGWRSSFL